MTEVTQERAREIFDEIATTLKNEGVLYLQSRSLGKIEFPYGILGDLSREKTGGYGMKHIIQGRYEKDGMSEKDISALLYLISEVTKNADESCIVFKNNSSMRIKKDGIIVGIQRKWYDIDKNWVITGFAENDKKNKITKEATDTIQTVIAEYGYALEHSCLCEQVGAVIASIKNIRQELEKVKGDESKMPENKIDALIEKCRSRVWREALPEEWERGEFLAGAAAAYLEEHGLGSEFEAEEKMVDLLSQVDKEYLHSEADCPLETNVEYAIQRCREREMERTNSKEVNAAGEIAKDERQYGNTVASNNINSREETKMAEMTKEQQIAELERKLQEMKSEVAQEQGMTGAVEQQFGTIKDDLQQVPNNGGYVRKTEDILTKDTLHNESMSRYGMVTKGWLMSKVSVYEIESKNGNFYRSQMLVGSQAPTSIVFDPATGSQKCQFPEKTYFEFVEMDTKTKPDFSRCEPGKNQEMIEFSGVKCEITQRSADGKSLHKTTERFFAKSAWVTQLDENKRPVLDREGKAVREFISAKENSMDNLVERTGREFIRGHYIEHKQCFGFNKEITDQQGVTHGYRHQICIATPTFENGSRVVENGIPKATFTKLTWRTDNKLTDAEIEKTTSQKDLAIKYQKHIYRYKGQDNQWHTGRTNELVNLGRYLERDKTIEKDAAPNKVYEGVVEDFSRSGFNTRSDSGDITAHRWEDLSEIADAAKIKLGEKVKLEYNKDMKISKVSQPEKSQAKTKQQDKGLSM